MKKRQSQFFYRGAKLRSFYRIDSTGKIRFTDKWEENAGLCPVTPGIIDAFIKDKKLRLI